MNCTRILVSIPKPDKAGGVAAYFNAISSKLSVEVNYVLRGSRSPCKNPFKKAARLLRDYRDFQQHLARNTYDLVHLNTSLGFGGLLRDSVFILIAKKLYRKKVLVFFHGWDWKLANWISGPLKIFFRNTFGQADSIIVLSSEFKRQLNQWGYSKPVYLETTAVEDDLADQYRPKSHHATVIQRHRNINILFLARVEKTKGVYEVIDTFKILKQKHRDVILTIAGSGTELDRLKMYVTQQAISDVRFAGFVSGAEKSGEFNQADIYLFPSYYYEGLPTSVLEAMCFGLPVVTRSVGGLKDIFEDEKMGFMVDSLDTQVLADLMERLILSDDLRWKMGTYNREYAHQRFVGSQVARRLENIYQQAIADGSNVGKQA